MGCSPVVRVLIGMFAALILISCAAGGKPQASLVHGGGDSFDSSEAQNQTYVVWVYFKDKGPGWWIDSTIYANVVSSRSLERRRKVRPEGAELDFTDYPVFLPYLLQVERGVESVRHTSKWFNAVSVVATQDQLEEVGSFSFVLGIDLVDRYEVVGAQQVIADIASELVVTTNTPQSHELDYGYSENQLSQLNVQSAHERGNYGQGVLIGMFDDGFLNMDHSVFDSISVVATHDFVLGREEVGPLPNEAPYGDHGHMTLSTIGGFAPGFVIGPAFGADYVLARTEDAFSETPLEEDNFVAAIEWADSIGIDIASISLGYLAYDDPYQDITWEDMDGNTALITRAVDMAVSKGILVVTSAGNNTEVQFDTVQVEVPNQSGGLDTVPQLQPSRDVNGDYVVLSQHNTLGAPADADSVLTVGAVDPSGDWIFFSSMGPTSDTPSRIKPDVSAQGYQVVVAGETGFRYANGTSFSCPLTAGAAALVLGDMPLAAPMEIHASLKMTANNAGSPNIKVGWGIPDIEKAVEYLRIP